MANKRYATDVLAEALAAVEAHGGSVTDAARALGIPRTTLQARLAAARGSTFAASMAAGQAQAAAAAQRSPAEPSQDALRSILLRGPMTLDEIAARLGCTKGQALDAVDALHASGLNVQCFGGRYQIDRTPAPQRALGVIPTYQSRADNTFVFGFTSDNHLGSRYARLDVLNALYDWFAAMGVDRVFNAGNWIDGESRFNRHDLLVHGLDRQIAYLVENYPRRDGITTYAVAGDDHEGWYVQREGIDIGRHAENAMREAGRTDWVHLGYMEAFVDLKNANSGASSKLLNCHPGGGSAYAISYTSQKSAEAFDGGEKPAVLLARPLPQARLQPGPQHPRDPDRVHRGSDAFHAQAQDQRACGRRNLPPGTGSGDRRHRRLRRELPQLLRARLLQQPLEWRRRRAACVPRCCVNRAPGFVDEGHTG